MGLILDHMKQEPPKRKRGRPTGYRVEEPRNKSLNTKITEMQLSTYKTAAEAKGVTFSAWVRGALDREAGEASPPE